MTANLPAEGPDEVLCRWCGHDTSDCDCCPRCGCPDQPCDCLLSDHEGEDNAD